MVAAVTVGSIVLLAAVVAWLIGQPARVELEDTPVVEEENDPWWA